MLGRFSDEENSLEISFLNPENMIINGFIIQIQIESGVEKSKTKRSGFSLAIDLGLISPKIRTSIVITAVETPTPFEPIRLVKELYQ